MFPTEDEFEVLKPFFEPASIALIGASDDPEKPGGRPQRALLDKGYTGTIYPVNPKHDTVLGLKCYPSLAAVDAEVELAVISVPARGVYTALEECAAKGVKAAVIFSSGFAETGPEGKRAQEELARLAREKGIRLCGPNCLGVVNTLNGVMASFAFIVDLPDVDPRTLGFVTQSGAFGAMIYAHALTSGVGLNYFVSVGNEADLDFVDFLGYMVRDDHTGVVGGYLEGLKDGRKLRRVAEKAAEAQKPVMIMKVGRSSAGARAASSHTGSLAGVDKIYDAFFRQTGIIRINDQEELLAFVPIVSAGRLPRGKNVALLTISGGAGVKLADTCEGLGLHLPRFEEKTRSKMEKVLPFFASAQNPIDLTAQYLTDPEMLFTCLRTILGDDSIDIVVANIDLRDPYGKESARRVIEMFHSTDKTLVVCPWILPGEDEGQGVKELRQAGVPVVINTYRAIQAIAHLAGYAEFLRKRQEEEYRVPVYSGSRKRKDYSGFHGPLSEGRSKALLAEFGIPVTREGLARSREEALALAQEIGYPVVLKVDSPDIPHKSEVGALSLNLNCGEDVERAYAEITKNVRSNTPNARINGVLVQEMLPKGTEVIIGMTKDPVFGPTLMFGLGGIFVEVLKDVSFRVLPLSRGDVMDMIRETRGFRVLQGVRGEPPADISALVETVLKITDMVLSMEGEIEELDINPLIVYPENKGVKAADAMVVLKKDCV